MPESVALSILIVLLGGVMTGSFALPLRAEVTDDVTSAGRRPE